MNPYSLTTLRGALGNVDAATRKTARMPRHSFTPAVSDRDYLGWRDPSAPQRGYLFVEGELGPIGVMITKTRSRNSVQRAVMCEFCRLPRRFDQVVLFTAPTSLKQADQSTFGTYLCVDLDCNARVNAMKPVTPLDPPAPVLVAKRRAELAQRARAFITEVLERAAA
ncbi:FBP domain-containing protein [Leucobacter albus]|uniref:FBP domain-containing protein n=1 Tax=Leucobacter albus TaxID=272210 RepID=A0ABW3TRH5_9MICO